MGSDWNPEVSEADEAANSEAGDGFDLDEFLRTARGTYRLLSQDRVWVDNRGRMFKLEEMSVRYKTNVLRFLRKRASRLGMLYQWGSISDLGQPRYREVIGHEGGPDGRGDIYGKTFSEFELMGDNVMNAYDHWQDELTNEIKRDPEAWLDSTPLMQALSEQVAAGQGGNIGDRPEDAPV